MWLLIFSIDFIFAIVAPDNSIINESDIGPDVYVYSREYDEIIYESDTSDIKLCHSILSVNYGKFLKNMTGDNFKGKKRDLLTHSNNYTNLNYTSKEKLFTREGITREGITRENTTDSPTVGDGVIALSARCPTYLSYIKCIYSNYIRPLSHTSHSKKYTNDFLKHINDGLLSEPRSTFTKTKGGDLSFHLRQVLLHFCQFIRYACPKLLDSFAIINELKGRDWNINSYCSAFDFLTPITNFNDLYDKSIQGVNDTTIAEFTKSEINAFISFEFRCDFIKSYQRGYVDNNLLYTTIGTLYDIPINNKDNLNQHFFIYCVELCTLLTSISNLKKYYSKEGLARFYFICAYRELDCNIICGVCN